MPEAAEAKAIPAAENVPELTTVPIRLFVIVALVDSLPAKEVADNPLCIKPTFIAQMSGLVVAAKPEIVLPDMIMPSSNVANTPPVDMLSGAAVFIRF